MAIQLQSTDKITDRQSFIQFMELLHQDFINNKAGWENKTVDTFLEAMTRYAEDVQYYYNNTNQNINANDPSWRVFADILVGAAIYE